MRPALAPATHDKTAEGVRHGPGRQVGTVLFVVQDTVLAEPVFLSLGQCYPRKAHLFACDLQFKRAQDV